MSSCPHCGRKGRGYRKEPLGYVAWHVWAEKLGRTHRQERCPGCGRFSVWRSATLAARIREEER
jgi:predicted RNA-binding Zn-ribbon protein involved in translation (DUF1610 family)